MIPKATILAVAHEANLLPSTVDKDYVLGWLLYGISRHPYLSTWIFKGGTCLKKCFFETYRFSEDLDFTVPATATITEEQIGSALAELTEWVNEESGIAFPASGLQVEGYTNKQGADSYEAKITYVGPLALPRSQQQRIKLDITQHEIIVSSGELRGVSHPYDDAMDPAPEVRCYTVDEILAEKTRALYERQGRARDVYDVVHVSRSFRDEVTPSVARDVLLRKFAFKGLEPPTVDGILARIDTELLASSWAQQLKHQLPVLPDARGFIDDLGDALRWWVEGAELAQPAAIPAPADARPVARAHFPYRRSSGIAVANALPDAIRFGARNRVLVRIAYHGAQRVVEPYSLRIPSRGGLLLFAFELSKDGVATETLKAYRVAEIGPAEALARPFSPRWAVEL